MNNATNSDDGEYSAEFQDGYLILKGKGQNRAISSEELDELLQSDGPVTIR